MAFKEIAISELKLNPFDKISNEWMLISAGNEKKSNTMTASWGAMGIMWGKSIATVYIRQSRFTKEFVDREEYFTVSFLGEEYRKALAFCGAKSGRDYDDKWSAAGLTALPLDNTVGAEEAELIFVCKKQYHTFMSPDGFDVKENDGEWYADKDYHEMYMGEIVKVLVKE